MASFTVTQGRYLSFIHTYTRRHGYPPAESEIAAAMCVSPPSVNQMVKALERHGLISRQPGTPRSIRVLIPEAEIPSWRDGHAKGHGSSSETGSTSQPTRTKSDSHAAPPTNLYVFQLFLVAGPLPPEFDGKVISRTIEIRGDQTLAQFHDAISHAYDRQEQRGYEFQLGRRSFDPQGPNYGIPKPRRGRPACADSRTTTLDGLGLEQHRVFGYWFDFDANWYHHVQLERIEKAIPTVTYPRVTRRVGKSPPQFATTKEAPHVGHATRGPQRGRSRPLRSK